MATGNVIVSVVDVGQGQCTFIEVYDTASPTPKLIHTLLFDCGSDKSSTETQANLSYIVERVSSMKKPHPPAFDCIIFSHSDNDHISLTAALLKKFPASKKPTVKEVWYGGNRDQYEKDSVNILDDLITGGYCTDKDIKSTGANYSGFDPADDEFNRYLWQSDDELVSLNALVCNILSANPNWTVHPDVPMLKSPEAKNRASIICGLYYAGVSYVVCGDATNGTMAAVNKLFKDGTTAFDNNIMTTLPHHGSRRTALGAAESNRAWLTVRTFAGLLKSKTITVSAYELHSHPSLEMMIDFAPSGTPLVKDPRFAQGNVHRVTANIDRSLTIKPKTKPGAKKKATASGWVIQRDTDYSFDTITNTFTTQYSRGLLTFSFQLNMFAIPTEGGKLVTPIPTFNPFACWKYTTKSDGKFTIEGYSKLGTGGNIFTEAVTTAKTLQERSAPQLSVNGKKNVSVRMRLPETGKPINIRSGFQSRLMQFR